VEIVTATQPWDGLNEDGYLAANALTLFRREGGGLGRNEPGFDVAAHITDVGKLMLQSLLELAGTLVCLGEREFGRNLEVDIDKVATPDLVSMDVMGPKTQTTCDGRHCLGQVLTSTSHRIYMHDHVTLLDQCTDSVLDGRGNPMRLLERGTTLDLHSHVHEGTGAPLPHPNASH
jgi:hypothetical protein